MHLLRHYAEVASPGWFALLAKVFCVCHLGSTIRAEMGRSSSWLHSAAAITSAGRCPPTMLRLY